MVVVFVKAFEAFCGGSTGSHLSVMRYVTHVKKSNRNRFSFPLDAHRIRRSNTSRMQTEAATRPPADLAEQLRDRHGCDRRTRGKVAGNHKSGDRTRA